jgi:uncharacterized repeat protein (TIGR02543 family)
MFKKGFSLLEVLLIITIIVVIFSFSIPFSLKLYHTQLLEGARNDIVDVLQRAKHNAILQKNDSSFGVQIDAGLDNFVLFQGASYADRVQSLDEVYDLLPGIAVFGPAEIVFSKLTGLPSVTGTTTLDYLGISRGLLIEGNGNISNVVTVARGALNPFGGAFAVNGDIWIANYNLGTVSQFDGTTGDLIDTFDVGNQPAGVVVDGNGNVWVTNSGSNDVTLLDGATGAVIGTYDVGTQPIGIVIDDNGNIWVANYVSNDVTELDGTTGAVIGTYDVGSQPVGIAVDGSGNILITNSGSGTISVLDVTDGSLIDTYDTGGTPYGIVVDAGGNIWIADNGSNNVIELDGTTGGTIGTYDIGNTSEGIAIDSDGNIAVWNQNSGTVSILDGITGDLINTTIVGCTPCSGSNFIKYGHLIIYTNSPGRYVLYNGGTYDSGATPSPRFYLPGDTATVQGNVGFLSLPPLARTGHTFAGWNTAADGSGTTYNAGDTFVMGSSNITLYAQWESVAVGLPTITSLSPDAGSPDGGEQITITGTNFVDVLAVYFGTTTATTTTVSSSTQILAIAPAGEYGQVDVSVVTSIGTSSNTVADDYTYQTGDEFCTYTYSAWSSCVAAEQTRTVVSALPDPCVGTPVLSQACELTYNVTYDGNGRTSGNVPNDLNDYLVGDTVTVMSNSGNLVKTGYTFSGWGTDLNGGVIRQPGAQFTMESGNLTLYAYWVANPTYDVTYNGNGNTGGGVPSCDASYEEGDVVNVCGNNSNLVKTGYTFDGWNTSADGSGTSRAVASEFAMPAANVTLYAKWVEDVVCCPDDTEPIGWDWNIGMNDIMASSDEEGCSALLQWMGEGTYYKYTYNGYTYYTPMSPVAIQLMKWSVVDGCVWSGNFTSGQTQTIWIYNGGDYSQCRQRSVTAPTVSTTPVTCSIPDVADPEITGFTTPPTVAADYLYIGGITLSATDDKAVTGYLINESASTPSLSDAGWSATAPTAYSFGSSGNKVLYAWAKDAAGKISAPATSSVAATLEWYATDLPETVSWNNAPAACAALPTEGGINPGVAWRVPSGEEFNSRHWQFYPDYTGWTGGAYWMADPDTNDANYAWTINMTYVPRQYIWGELTTHRLREEAWLVRCVRD